MTGLGNITLVAASVRADEKMTCLPSGVKSLGRSVDEWNVRRMASPPVAGIVKMSKLP
jgi:hypothetical protein